MATEGSAHESPKGRPEGESAPKRVGAEGSPLTANRTSNTTSDDWLDATLAADAREHGASYLDDRGFTARVMAALPAPLAVPRWRKPGRTPCPNALPIRCGGDCCASS